MKPDRPALQLTEVWGETVALRNLALALLISAPTTLATFLVARWLLESNMEDHDRADTFSLLVGLAAMIVCTVLCARLFRPQRVVSVESAEESTTFDQTLRELAAEDSGLGSVSDLPPEVQEEMRELGLYEAFAHAETTAHTGPAERGAR